METVPVPIMDKMKHTQSYTYLKINEPYIALNSEIYFIENTKTGYMQKDRL